LKVGVATTLVDVVTVKLKPLLATPPTVTTTFPVVAPAGTGATMPVALQLDGVVAMRSNVTVPAVPKLVPVMVTEVPTGPEDGLRFVIFGLALPLALAFVRLWAWRGTLISEVSTTMQKGKQRVMESSRKYLTSFFLVTQVSSLGIMPNGTLSPTFGNFSGF